MHRLAPPLLVTGLFFTGLALRIVLADEQTAPASTVEARPVAAHSAAKSSHAAPPQNFSDFLDSYCFECHDEKPKGNTLSLATFDVSKADQHAEIGEKMVRKLRAG